MYPHREASEILGRTRIKFGLGLSPVRVWRSKVAMETANRHHIRSDRFPQSMTAHHASSPSSEASCRARMRVPWWRPRRVWQSLPAVPDALGDSGEQFVHPWDEPARAQVCIHHGRSCGAIPGAIGVVLSVGQHEPAQVGDEPIGPLGAYGSRRYLTRRCGGAFESMEGLRTACIRHMTQPWRPLIPTCRLSLL